jgi:hypothetical protein
MAARHQPLKGSSFKQNLERDVPWGSTFAGLRILSVDEALYFVGVARNPVIHALGVVATTACGRTVDFHVLRKVTQEATYRHQARLLRMLGVLWARPWASGLTGERGGVFTKGNRPANFGERAAGPIQWMGPCVFHQVAGRSIVPR